MAELKHCLEPGDLPAEGGNRLLRACGTRFVAHKVAALDKIIDCFGACINHLSCLAKGASVRAVYREKIIGYVCKWHDAKMLLGCVYFHDVLKPMSILCKVLQSDGVCVVHALEAIMKSTIAVECVKEAHFKDLPSVLKVTLWMKQEGEACTYQGANLLNYTEGVQFFENHHQGYINVVQSCLEECMTEQENELLKHTLNVLATQGWDRDDNASFGYPALFYLSQRFQYPLQYAGIDIAALESECDEIVDFAKCYLNIFTEKNSVIWWKLFNAPVSKDCSNILGLVELLFSLPMSNGHLERIFSQYKLIRTNSCTGLGEDRLDSLLCIVITDPPLSEWDRSSAVQLWWSDKKC